jgi:hypothetical protein
MDREQINCYLWDGRLACPLQLPTPTSNLWGSGDIKCSTLSGNTIAVKGKEPCCSFPSAVCWPRLAPADRHAHMASWVTPWGNHSCMASQAATRKGQE